MKALACRELGSECPFVARAATEKDVMKVAMQHSLDVHNMKLDDAMAAKSRELIREE